MLSHAGLHANNAYDRNGRGRKLPPGGTTGQRFSQVLPRCRGLVSWNKVIDAPGGRLAVFTASRQQLPTLDVERGGVAIRIWPDDDMHPSRLVIAAWPWSNRPLTPSLAGSS